MKLDKLTLKDFQSAAEKLRCEIAEIQTVEDVESKGEAFYPDGFPVILFERHKFHKFTGGEFDETHPEISNAEAGGYGRAGANQRRKFNLAFSLNPEAAMKSCSWGKFQLMGFNHKLCGFDTVGKFVDAMKESEAAQLLAFTEFIINTGLGDELRNRKWAAFALGYNGENYKENEYDTKLAAAYKKFSKQNSLPAENAPMLAESESAVPRDAFQAPAGESADVSSEGFASSSAASNSDENNTAKEIKTSETKETEEGSKSIEVTEKLPLGDAPDAAPRHWISVEDWKCWVFSKLKLTWGSFGGVNFTQGTSLCIASLKSGEYWYVPVIISAIIFIFTFIVCVLLSIALLAIWHFNRKEIVGYIKMAKESVINPESYNLGLKFESK